MANQAKVEVVTKDVIVATHSDESFEAMKIAIESQSDAIGNASIAAVDELKLMLADLDIDRDTMIEIGSGSNVEYENFLSNCKSWEASRIEFAANWLSQDATVAAVLSLDFTLRGNGQLTAESGILTIISSLDPKAGHQFTCRWGSTMRQIRSSFFTLLRTDGAEAAFDALYSENSPYLLRKAAIDARNAETAQKLAEKKAMEEAAKPDTVDAIAEAAESGNYTVEAAPADAPEYVVNISNKAAFVSMACSSLWTKEASKGNEDAIAHLQKVSAAIDSLAEAIKQFSASC